VVACAALVVLGAGVTAFEVLTTVLVQRLARREVLGLVFGLVGTASNAGKLLGAVAAPAAVGVVGLRGSINGTAALLALVTAASGPGLLALGGLTRARPDQLAPRVALLARTELFAGAPATSLERLAQHMELVHLPPATVVVRQGDVADDLYLVESGSLAVDVSGTVITTMGGHDWFGEIGLVQRRPRTATVTTTAATALWRIPGGAFLESIGDSGDPSALFGVMSTRLGRGEDR